MIIPKVYPDSVFIDFIVCFVALQTFKKTCKTEAQIVVSNIVVVVQK